MVRAITLTASAVLLLGCILIQESLPHRPIKESVKFDFNDGIATFDPSFLQAMSFGYPRLLSGVLWLRFLQETPPISLGENEVSWVFMDLYAVSKIDPDFYPTYLQGAMFMSVITEDIKGSTLLLEEGVKRYPNYWKMRAYLAYHYEQNLQDYEEAAAQYERAALLPGAPKFFKPLAATMYTKGGDSRYAIQVIKQMLDKAREEDIKKRLQEKLARLLNEYD